MTDNLKRCAWVSHDPIYIDYHDNEWGVPIYDDRKLFEFLCLEGAQAGLSWITILKKRPNYRKVFANFNPKKIAAFDDVAINNLLNDSGIVRNKLKILAFINNAQIMQDRFSKKNSFSEYIWNFVDGCPIKNHFKSIDEVPATTKISDLMAKDLKRLGFKFVGSTICYAFMQAVGMVDDHTTGCFKSKMQPNAG